MASDPSAFLREMPGQWEKMANSFGDDTLKSEEFTRSLHGANAAGMAMQAAMGQAIDKALAPTNLPSRSDIVDLSARVGRVEASRARIGMIGSVDKEEVVLKDGHVSLVAGGNAIHRLWPKLAHWLGTRST